MSSTKCPSCGLDNFSSALVCRRCHCPLMGEFARALRENRPTRQNISSRWVASAVLLSLAFAVVLFLVFFLATVIPNAMNSGATGWMDYTSDQKWSMTVWYMISLAIGVSLIVFLCYRRRRKYHTEG